MKEPLDYKGVVHYKTYPRFENIILDAKLPHTTLRHLIRNRRTRRLRSETSLDISLLHPLLNLAVGRTGKPETADEDFRGYPSAGARYPLELYIVSFDVEGLECGVYHFNPYNGSLEVLLRGDFLGYIHEALNEAIPGFDTKARAFIIVTSISERTTFKYGDEGRIFPYIEAGYMGANIVLLLEEAGINSVITGVQWCKGELVDLLDINPAKEEVVSGIGIL